MNHNSSSLKNDHKLVYLVVSFSCSIVLNPVNKKESVILKEQIIASKNLEIVEPESLSVNVQDQE